MVRTIDIHTHLFPHGAREAAQRGGQWEGATFGLTPAGNPVMTTNGKSHVTASLEHLLDIDERVAKMDELQVDIQVLSLLPTFMGYDLPPQTLVSRARAANEELSRYITAHPDRFRALAAIAPTDVDASIAELESAMQRPGFVGVQIGSHVGDVTWGDDQLFPILQAAERLNAFVFIHPIDVRGGKDLGRFHLRNGLGNPLETTLAAATLIFTGVLDRLPGLRLCLAHGGGYLAMAAGRLDHIRRVRPETHDTTANPPSSYLRRFHFDALTHDPKAVRFLVDVLGADRVVLGSDYPADMSSADPAGEIRLSDLLTDQEKEAILGGNLQRELGIGT